LRLELPELLPLLERFELPLDRLLSLLRLEPVPPLLRLDPLCPDPLLLEPLPLLLLDELPPLLRLELLLDEPLLRLELLSLLRLELLLLDREPLSLSSFRERWACACVASSVATPTARQSDNKNAPNLSAECLLMIRLLARGSLNRD